MIRIIKPNGETEQIRQDYPPTYGQLKKWIGCDVIELVKIFYNGKYEYMYVDEVGAIKKPPLPVNAIATLLYHENARVHQPELLKNAPSIYGVAVLVTSYHKEEEN